MSQKLFLPKWLNSSYEIKWVTPAQVMLQILFTLSEKLILTFAKGDLKLCETKYTDILRETIKPVTLAPDKGCLLIILNALVAVYINYINDMLLNLQNEEESNT